MRIYDDNGLTEQEFLRRYAEKNYPRPSLTADVVILSQTRQGYEVLLVRRKNHPYLDCWALPGGFAKPNEPLEQTAARELVEETGVENLPLRLIGVYSTPGRDPRGWVVSAAYMALAPADRLKPVAGDDAKDASWFQIFQQENRLLLKNVCFAVSELAFDHAIILRDALRTAEKQSGKSEA